MILHLDHDIIIDDRSAVFLFMNSTNTKLIEYGKYLASLIASSINETAPKEPFDGMDWERLYSLALLHNVAVLIYPAVKALDPPAEIMEKFTYNYNRMIAREARQEIEAQRVFSALDAAGTRFIKMKGIVLKNHYPMPYMRTHSDVDICMTSEDRKKSRPIMEALGYKFINGIDYHDEYEKDRFFIYELHSSVMSKRSPFYNIFDNPFDKATPDTEGPGYIFTDKYFYLGLVIHLYKHFVSEGCGIRLLCDLYVFEKTHPELDINSITRILEKYDLAEFYSCIRNLCDCLFGGKELDGRLTLIAEFILRSGEYGSPELKRLSWISSDKSANLSFRDKSKYFLHNWFPGVRTMKRRYPILEKAPILLPVCWVRRGFYTLFFKPQALKEQHGEIKKMNSDEMKAAKQARILAGVKE